MEIKPIQPLIQAPSHEQPPPPPSFSNGHAKTLQKNVGIETNAKPAGRLTLSYANPCVVRKHVRMQAQDKQSTSLSQALTSNTDNRGSAFDS